MNRSTRASRGSQVPDTAPCISRVCAESPIKLRLCKPGEEGSVISNYITLGEDQPYEWNIAPLSIYLYGTENPKNRPLIGSPKLKYALEERYLEKYLSAYCTTPACRTSFKSEWREMVGATLSRSLYIFIIGTTLEQDRAFIAEFNAQPNVNHFNGVTRNCATFTRSIINSFFPHATSADYLNDFGMTSPKAIARSFTRYALHHPGTQFRVLHFAQLPGTIKRSSEVRDGTEQLYHSKKLLVPMIVFASHELPAVAATYVLTARFNPEHESEEYPTAEATESVYQIHAAKSEKDSDRAEQLDAAESEERARVVGTSAEWKAYSRKFSLLVKEDVRQEIIPERPYLDRFFKYLDEKGTPFIDRNGALWFRLSGQDGATQVGVSASNMYSSQSDSRLAYQLLLTRVNRELKSPKHSRETMREFRKDWELLQATRTKSADSVAAIAAQSANTPSVPSSAGGKD